MSLIPRGRGARQALAALSVFTLFAIGGCGSSDSRPSADTQTSTTGSSTTASNAGSSSTSTAASSTPGRLVEITVAGGQVTGGVKRVNVDIGESVTIRITSDVAEEVHVHGYDLMRDLTPGAPVELSFTADIPGVFEVELEQSGLEVAELQVA